MNIGILIPTRGVVLASARRPPVDECWAMARLADQAGYDAVWVGDSVVAKPRLEPLTTLAYLAAITGRVRLGTAVLLPAGCNEAEFRRVAMENFNRSLGAGLGKMAGKVFRIGHLGDFNDLALLGTLAGVEMGLELAAIPIRREGVQSAMASLLGAEGAGQKQRAAA
jgi:hypothetical protein